MWNDIVKANCARAKTTASKPSNIAAFRRLFRARSLPKTAVPFSGYCPIRRRSTTSDATIVRRSSAIGAEQPCDGALDLLVLALAVVLEDDFAVLVDDVLRRPILVAGRRSMAARALRSLRPRH